MHFVLSKFLQSRTIYILTVNCDITNEQRQFHILHAILSFLNTNHSLVRTLCFRAFTIKQVIYN